MAFVATDDPVVAVFAGDPIFDEACRIPVVRTTNSDAPAQTLEDDKCQIAGSNYGFVAKALLTRVTETPSGTKYVKPPNR